MKINDFLDSPQSNNHRAEAVRIDDFLGEPAQRSKLLGLITKILPKQPESVLSGKVMTPEQLATIPSDPTRILPSAPISRPPQLELREWTPPQPRSTLRAIADAAIGVHQGGTGVIKGVADNINAGNNPVSNFLSKVIEGGDKLKSDDLRNQQAYRNMMIHAARKNQGESGAARAAFNTLFDQPAAGIDVVVRGAGSIVPTIGLGMLGAGTKTLGAVNALSNAGESASQTADALRVLPPAIWAKDPRYQQLIGDGISHAQAVQILAPLLAVPSQAVGAVTGAISGSTGIERMIAGKAVGNSALNRAGRVGTELVTEQGETIAPLITGNATVGSIDGETTLTRGIGQAAVDTIAGTLPGAALAAHRVPDQPVAAEPGVTSTNGIAALADLIADTAIPESRLEAQPIPAAPSIDSFLDSQTVGPIPNPKPTQSTTDPTQTAAVVDDKGMPAIDPGVDPAAAEDALINVEDDSSAQAVQIDPQATITPAAEESPFSAAEAAPTTIIEQKIAKNSEAKNTNSIQAPARIDFDKAMQITEAKPGMRPGDLVSINGVPFANKSRAQAVVKDAGPGWRIARSNGGFVGRFQPATQKQIDSARLVLAKRRQVDTERDSMFAAIAKMGGISRQQAMGEWGMDPASFKNLMGSGIMRVVTTKGRGLDAMAELLAEAGYLSYDENGKHDVAEFEDLFFNELAGSPHYTPEGFAREAQDEAAARYDEYLSEKEASASGFNDLKEQEQENTSEFMGEFEELTEADYAKLEQETIAWEQAATQQDAIIDNNDETIDVSGGRLDQANERIQSDASGEGGSNAGNDQAREDEGQEQAGVREDGAGSSRTTQETFSLESQTEATLKAAEEAKAAAEKAKQEADRAAEARAQADAKVGQFNLTGSDRAADVAAAQGQQDLLGGTPNEPTKPKPGIKDFGEKIGGARKDVWNLYGDNLDAATELDAADVPFAKAWPEPNYQKLIEAGADPKTVAVVRAMRESVPTKPKKSYRLKSWADNVETLRNFANDLVKGKMPVNEIEILNKYSAISGMADLYMAVGHSKSLANLRLSSGSYSFFEGKTYSPAKTIWAVEKTQAKSSRRWPTQLVTADTREEAISKFKESFDQLMNGATEKKSIEFVIYSRTKDKKFYVGKKVGRNYVDLAGGFNTSKEAREYRATNQEELVAKLEKIKETPRVRREDNNPRVGEDMRNGEDVTPQYFGETFGFKGVEFGNWVEQGKRQADLNEAFDALMDMAAVLGLPPKALSLNGELSLAFGARGKGGIDPAKAHYESSFVVINMTKKNGAGSLGHEWWHALDNYFSRMGKYPNDYLTSSTVVSLAASGYKYVGLDDVRTEMIESFGRVMKAIRESQLKSRSAKMDAKRSKEYWGTSIEMSARSFESYLIAKLADNNASNDYLANIVSEKGWKANEALGAAEEGSYPYPTVEEMPALRAAFDSFFQAIETAPSDKGIRVFSRSSGDQATGSVSAKPVEALAASITSKFPGAPMIRVADKVSDLFPFEDADSDSRVTGAVTNGEIILFLKGLKSLRDAERTVFHELLHYGLRRFLTRDQFITQMQKLYVRDEVLRKEADDWIKNDPVGQETLALHGQDYAVARGIDEALAGLAEINPEQYFKPSSWQKMQETLRKWLAQLADFLGFNHYAAQVRSMNPTEAQQLVREVFTKLQDNAPATLNPFVDLPDTAFRIKDMDDDLQDDIDLGVPKKKFEKVSAKDLFSLSKNEFGQTQYAAGMKLYKNLSTLARGHLGAIKLADNKPEAFKQMMRQFKVDQLKANENAKRIAKVGMELSPEQRETLSDLVEKNAKPGDLPPTEVLDLAAKITAALDIQAKQLIDLGMISEDRLVKNYLPRLYKHGLSAKLTNPTLLAGWFTKARMRVRGDRLKTRGMFTEMPVSSVAMAKKLGWNPTSWTDGSELPKDLFEAFDKSQPIPPNYQDAKVLMWRDYTESERAEMGEIRDGVFRYAMGYVETQKDIAIGRLFKAISTNSELAKTFNPGGWKQVPTTAIKGAPGVKQYGALSGMYVNPQVLDSLTRNTQPKGILMAAYDKALNFWKEGKTVWNPVSHGNNVVSNLFTVYFAGVNPTNPSRWRETLREFRTKGAFWNEAVDNGLFGNEFANQEIQQLLMPDFGKMEDIESVAASRVAKIVEFSKKYPGRPFSWYRENMQKAYEFEDQFFKLMLYIDRRKSGMDPQNAITDAERYVFNYSDMPEGIEFLKRTYSPFFAYTYRAIPMLVHTFMHRPDRLLAPIALLGGANWLAYMTLGADADEEEERKGMPEYMKGRTAIGTPKSIRMPFNIDDRPAFMDLSRRVPLGDLFDMNNQTDGMPLPAPFMPSHPVFSIAQAVIYNQDTFTGKDLVKKSDTKWEAAEARAAYLYRQFAPNAPLIPGSYNFNKLMDASANTFDSELLGYTGKTKAGDPIKAIPTVLDVFTGTKIRSFDPDRGIDYRAAGLQKEAQEIQANISSAHRDKSMTPGSKDRFITAQQEKLNELRRRNEELRK